MSKQPYQNNLSTKSLFVVLLFFYCHCFSQTNTNNDSAKLNSISKTPINDSILKYGTGKVGLSGHSKTIPIPALQDADHDGVPDQLDLEPDTPKGADVDTHGRALDTDGDGVPDYKDKEKLTLQKCFPVNVDGIGTCPESLCCKESSQKLHEVSGEDVIADPFRYCKIVSLPSIKFKKASIKLSGDAIKLLDSVAAAMKNCPYCKIKIFTSGPTDKRSKQIQTFRVFSIIRVLSEKMGISGERISSEYDDVIDHEDVLDIIPY